MINRFVFAIILVPIAIILIALAVANRELVLFTLDPFNPGSAGLSVQMPLFVPIFLALAVGAILGSLVTWWKQGRYRKIARQRAIELDAAKASVARSQAHPVLPRPSR